MSYVWIALAFVAGWLACWWFGNAIMKKVLRKGWQMNRVMRNLPPDSFAALRKAVEEETTRRNTLL